MHDRDTHALSQYRTQGTVRIPEQEHLIRLLLLKNRFGLQEHGGELPTKGSLPILQHIIRRTQTELGEENFA
ncbi:hypothetical protein D3C85_1840810 [compost metagenome]